MAASLLQNILGKITNKFCDLDGNIMKVGEGEYVEVSSTSHSFKPGDNDDILIITISRYGDAINID
jgi:hypothetical protein